jgi:hypothetical protein
MAHRCEESPTILAIIDNYKDFTQSTATIAVLLKPLQSTIAQAYLAAAHVRQCSRPYQEKPFLDKDVCERVRP